MTSYVTKLNFDHLVALGASGWYFTHASLIQIHPSNSGFIAFWGILSTGWLFHALVIRWTKEKTATVE